MKTTLPFNKQSITATIIVPVSEAEYYRTIFSSDGIKITEEIERGDDKHVFIVENLDITTINYLLERDGIIVHYYELLLNTQIVKAVFWMDNNRPSTIYLSFKDGQDDKGNDKWRGLVNIYGSKKDILDKEFEKYEVNWGAIGNVGTRIAWKFESALHTANILTDELNARIKKS